MRTLELVIGFLYYRGMTFYQRQQSGGIIVMALVVMLMIAMVAALIWYAFNGGKQATTPRSTPAETVIPID